MMGKSGLNSYLPRRNVLHAADLAYAGKVNLLAAITAYLTAVNLAC